MNMLIHAFSPVGLTRIIYVLLIICSAAVTAYFGKQMGADFVLVPGFSLLFWDIPDLSMGFFTAAGFAGISVLSAVFAFHAGNMHAEGVRHAKLVAQFAMLLLAADIFTNYMAWSTIRTQKSIVSQNSNTTAGDIRHKIKRLRSREGYLSGVISAPGAWINSTDAQKLLDDTLAARDREAARVKCGRECERLDTRAREIRETLGEARKREAAIAERDKVKSELVQAELEAREKNVVVDPTNAQNKELASTFAGMNPSERALFYSGKAIGIIGAILFSLSASACGFLLGELTGRRVSEATASRHPSYGDRMITAAPEFQPQPLQAADVPRATSTTSNVTVNYTAKGNPRTDALMEMIREFEAKAAT